MVCGALRDANLPGKIGTCSFILMFGCFFMGFHTWLKTAILCESFMLENIVNHNAVFSNWSEQENGAFDEVDWDGYDCVWRKYD